MTAAHLPGAILTPRYRGARAVAKFNAADARSRADNRGPDLAAVACISWPTPEASGVSQDVNLTKSGDSRTTPNKLGWAAAWATPATGKTRDDTVPRQAFGLANGEPEQTVKRGSLNPALSRWLMGFPPEWCAYAPTETRSCLSALRRSSAPSSNQAKA